MCLRALRQILRAKLCVLEPTQPARPGQEQGLGPETRADVTCTPRGRGPELGGKQGGTRPPCVCSCAG